jgi:hypothetical protein
VLTESEISQAYIGERDTVEGQLGACGSAYAGSEKGSNHFGSYVCRLFLYFYKRLFAGPEPMTSGTRQQLYCCHAELPFKEIQFRSKKMKYCNIQLSLFQKKEGRR